MGSCLTSEKEEKERYRYKLIYDDKEYDRVIKPTLTKILKVDNSQQSINLVLGSLNLFKRITEKTKMINSNIDAFSGCFQNKFQFLNFWKKAASYILIMEAVFKTIYYQQQIQQKKPSFKQKMQHHQSKQQIQCLINIQQLQKNKSNYEKKIYTQKLNFCMDELEKAKAKNPKLINSSVNRLQDTKNSITASQISKQTYSNSKRSILIIKSQQQCYYKIRKQDILLLMCLMSFNLTVVQDDKLQLASYNLINFSYIFAKEKYKSRCIKEYFDKIFNQPKKYQQGIVKIYRQVTNQSIQQLMKRHGDKKLNKLTIKLDNTDMEDSEFKNQIKVDFANKNFGGGALTNGSVQQELMVANRPQLYPIILLCQTLKDKQSLSLVGFRKYTKNKGYSYSAKYDGCEYIPYEIKQRQGCVVDNITVIDALNFSERDKVQKQFSQKSINREIIKAYTGFRFSINQKFQKIVSGNWGCGAFNGDVQLKFLIQWIAASLAGKQLVYCPFGKRAEIDVQKIIKLFRNQKQANALTIKQAYNLIKKSAQKIRQQRVKNFGLFEMIQRLSQKQEIRNTSSTSENNFYKNQENNYGNEKRNYENVKVKNNYHLASSKRSTGKKQQFVQNNREVVKNNPNNIDKYDSDKRNSDTYKKNSYYMSTPKYLFQNNGKIIRNNYQ